MPPDAVFTGERVDLDGTRSWWRDGFKHRLDGPSVASPDGRMEWHVDGRKLDGDALDELYRAGDQLAVEAVLRTWRHGGPTAGELAAAVRGALAA